MPSKATKLFTKMQQNPVGWHSHDLHTLYSGFGFTIKAGKKHDIASHPEHPMLRQIIPRHPEELSPAYVREAVKIIQTLKELTSK